MKIITWNVNGIRAVVKKWFKEFIEKENADIYCLQEVKAFEKQFIEEVWYIKWYNFLWHSWERPGYAGTAILYKNDLKIEKSKNFWEGEQMFNEDGRITEVTFEEIVLLNIYFPNWGTRADGTEMLTYKLNFYDKIIKYVNNLVAEWKNVIVTWDFNICHTEIDIARPEENKDSIWFLPIERAKITEFLGNGYIDTFRYFFPQKTEVYSWWSYRAWARPRNVGWRLDYFLVNKDFIENVESVEYLTKVEGSDHCPVKLEIKD
jgi:exodeoxyribonuclease-3